MNDQIEGIEMMVDKKIRTAAKAAVMCSSEKVDARIEIPDYSGMFVSLDTDEGILAIDFITVRNVRYVIGPVRK